MEKTEYVAQKSRLGDCRPFGERRYLFICLTFHMCQHNYVTTKDNVENKNCASKFGLS